MKFRSEAIRGGIKYLGGIQELEFITAAGLKANRKLELDVLAKQTKTSRFIRQLVISEIVSLVEPYQPDAVVSIPTGADHLTVGICQRMNIPGIKIRLAG